MARDTWGIRTEENWERVYVVIVEYKTTAVIHDRILVLSHPLMAESSFLCKVLDTSECH